MFKHKNILINGENLHGLQLLQGIQTYDFILIDPPYRTENRRLCYNDTMSREEWKEAMEERLKLSYPLLSNDGAIAVHIDDREYHTLRLVLDKVFGEDNYVNTLVVRRTTKNINHQFSKVSRLNRAFEFIVIYRKLKEFFYKNAYKSSSKKRQEGYWTSFQSNADRPTMRYEIEGVQLEKGQWKWSKERCFRALENYKKYEKEYATSMSLKSYWETYKDSYKKETGYDLEFVRKHDGKIQYWVKPSDKVLMNTNLMDYYASDLNGKKKYGFDTVKNLEMTKKIISMFTTPNSNILDFYAGSGTTGHAAMELNYQDGGNRTFTLITNDENNICSSICLSSDSKTSLYLSSFL